MKKNIIILTFVALFFLSNSFVFAADYEKEANYLKTLGLFSGTDKGFELERASKRVEAGAMLVKFLGKEKEALEKKYKHPFTDVPSWASDYIGYLYQNGITSGIGNNKFGSDSLISSKDFTVFVVKALGYTMDDFKYNETMSFAETIGLYSAEDKKVMESSAFTRDKMVKASYNLLSTMIKEGNKTLLEKLTDQGVVMNTQNSQSDVEIKGLYLADIPFSNLNVIEYKDDFMTFMATKKSIPTGLLGRVGMNSAFKMEDGREVYFRLNSIYPSWNGYNLVYKLSLIKDNKAIYSRVLLTKNYRDVHYSTIAAFFNIPEVSYDSIRVEVSPVSKSAYDPTVPLTKLSINESNEIEKKLSESYAFLTGNMHQLMISENIYSQNEAISRYIQAEGEWENFLNPHRGDLRLILDKNQHYSYKFETRDESGSSIQYPPQGLTQEIRLSLGTKSQEERVLFICLYDKDYKISEILILN